MLLFAECFSRYINLNHRNLFVSNLYLLDLSLSIILKHSHILNTLIFVMKFLEYIFQNGSDFFVLFLKNHFLFLQHFKHYFALLVQIFKIVVFTLLFLKLSFDCLQLQFELFILLSYAFKIVSYERLGLLTM